MYGIDKGVERRDFCRIFYPFLCEYRFQLIQRYMKLIVKFGMRYGIFRWGKPLTFYLAPDLWRYPMSGRTINLLLVIGTALRGGGLRYYPQLEQIKRPAN